ncbi:HlyU family transcriptional regulator [Aliagarivorans marinus]|uniref:HlyU family transcriptional regulator n=1 Tax=Aliagarivorans marinus TaxID=561965 RepID=UPI000414BBEB|nr:HlyU family transcriptional regulator [Aliagarivorans marinus]
MGIFSSIKALFAGGQSAASSHPAEDYQGFSIQPTPQRANGQYRVAALISKTIDGELKEHQFIRSDTCGSESDAAELALSKCRMFIDQQGEKIFEN